MTSPPPPARVTVYPSEDPTRTLVLRHGPSKQVAAFNWNRTSQAVTLGQWLKGKVYTYCVDVSRDGRHWLYLAMGRRGNPHTVLAKAPYFTALDYFEQGDTWGGGGIFVSDRSYVLAGALNIDNHFRKSGFEVLMGAEDVRSAVLKREGWQSLGDDQYVKPIRGDWKLYKDARYSRKSSSYIGRERHRIVNERSGQNIDCADWEWVDVFGREIHWSVEGRLMRAKFFQDTGPGSERLIHDLNRYTFEEKRAPY